MVHEILERRICAGAVVAMPVANRDKEWTGKRELGAAIRVSNKKIRLVAKDRLMCRHPPNDHVGHLCFPLVLKFANSLESADALQKFSDVMPAAPFAIADDVNARLFLEADRENHRVV